MKGMFKKKLKSFKKLESSALFCLSEKLKKKSV
jgi:hypothetical protein